MENGTEYQGWVEWAKKFKPKPNHLSKYEETMYETYGDEWDFVSQQDPKYVWTWVEGDLSSILVAGISYINRLGYYVCEVPWENEWDSCLLSVEEECECYDEDGYENGEYGRPDCEKCEGAGYVTDYL
jgi:hypothetical protein